jgi:hypothetical protein
VNTPSALTALLQFWKGTQAGAPNAPTNFNAVATSPTTIALTWTASAGATPTTQYEIARASAGSAFATITTISGTNFNNSVASGAAFIYKVRAIDTGGQSPYTPPDVATTFLFTDDPLLAQQTKVKVVHLNELRQAVNALRAAAGLPAASFTDPVISNTTKIKAAHTQELRTALNQARTTLGLSGVTFTDAALSTGVTKVRAVHFAELRNGVK